MSGESNNEVGRDARLLTVIIELLRQQLTQDSTHRLVNASRSAADTPEEWAQRTAAAGTHQQGISQAGFRESDVWLDSMDVPRTGNQKTRDAAKAAEDTTFKNGEQRVVIAGVEGPPLPVHVLGGTAEHEKAVEEHERARSWEMGNGLGPRSADMDKGKEPAGEKKEKEKGKEEAGAIAKTLAKNFGMLLGPVLAFSTILSASNSGFGVFQKAVSVLGASLAPILLPAFVMLAVAAVAVGDALFAKLLPKLGDWYRWIIESGIPAAEKLADAFGRAVDAIDYWADRVQHPEKFLGDVAADTDQIEKTGSAEGSGGLFDNLRKSPIFAPIKWAEDWGREQGEKMFGGGKRDTGAGDFSGSEGAAGGIEGPAGQAGQFKGPDVSGGAGGVKGILNDVMRSLQMSLGPKAVASQLQSVTTAAQLAATNQDPLDAKMLLRFMQSFEKLLGATEKNTRPDGGALNEGSW